MGNGEPLSSVKIIMFMITAMISINGIGVYYTNGTIKTQGEAMDELTKLVYMKMDDRYRRFEAEAAHDSLKDRIRLNERRDVILESKIDSHMAEDQIIHKGDTG
jgi:hypothetical protein